jgi:signal transduction histidine kinase
MSCVSSVPASLPGASAALAYLHELLCQSPEQGPSLDRLLDGLALAFDAAAAGLVLLPGSTLLAHAARDGASAWPTGPWPWEEQPELVGKALAGQTVSVPSADGSLLLAAGGSERAAWLLWLRAEGEREWTTEEGAALTLAASVLGRQGTPGGQPAWARQLDRAARQGQLECAAGVVRRLAHDYGNICTSILGFSELSIQPSVPPRTLQRYLQELYRSAQEGAALTQRLQLLARRPVPAPGVCHPGPVLAEEEQRLRALAGPNVSIRVELAVGLGALAITTEQLRQVLTVVFDNAREAVGPAGSIAVTARPRALSPADCLEYFGNVQPGEHGEIVVIDSGPGLSAEARERLFREPFYSSKPRKGGFGLLTAFGILLAHRGGLRWDEPGRAGGLSVRLVVPRALPSGTPRVDV